MNYNGGQSNKYEIEKNQFVSFSGARQSEPVPRRDEEEVEEEEEKRSKYKQNNNNHTVM